MARRDSRHPSRVASLVAIVKFGAMVVGIRGTVEGMKFSANKSGPYVTGWSRSANPRTQFQTSQRSVLASMSQAWRALSVAQLLAWNVFAALPAQDRVNSLGEVFSASGFNWFCIINTRLLNMGRALRQAVPTQSRPSAPAITTMQLPFGSREGAWVTYASGTFTPDFDQVIEIAIHPSKGLTAAPKHFKQLLLDQNPADTDAGFIVPYVNRINIGGAEYRGFARMYRQTTDGLRSAVGSKFFDTNDTPDFLPGANDYDGATNFGNRGADWTGNADSSIGLLSFWFRVDGADGTIRTIAQSNAGTYTLRLDASNRLDLRFRDSGLVDVVRKITDTTYVAGPDWHHAALAFDTDEGLSVLFVDGVIVPLALDTFVAAGVVDWTRSDHFFGANTASLNLWDGCMSQFYLNTVTTLDLEVNNNLRAFVNLDGVPEFLGAAGTFPTKDAPILFFPDADPAANSGTGGNYTNNAALNACGTNP